ncbi:MAG: WhiB family transcriptional regulator [Actinomycetota bacterium]
MTIIEQRETETLERAGVDLGLPMLETPFTYTPIREGADQETPVDFGGTDEMTDNWEDLAACRTVANAADMFFSEELSDIVAAKRICAECPVIAPCLEGAIRRAEPCGVWGGQLFANGRVLAQKRRRGRPPKVARPEDQLPVVPIPAHLQKLIA